MSEQEATTSTQEASTQEAPIYERKTDAEINQLAIDVVANRVFGTWMHPEAVKLSFGIITLFMEQEYLDKLKAAGIGHFYEYMDKAGPRGVNGLPSFFSCRLLSSDDGVRLGHAIKRLVEMQESFMKEPAQATTDDSADPQAG